MAAVEEQGAGSASVAMVADQQDMKVYPYPSPLAYAFGGRAEDTTALGAAREAADQFAAVQP